MVKHPVSSLTHLYVWSPSLVSRYVPRFSENHLFCGWNIVINRLVNRLTIPIDVFQAIPRGWLFFGEALGPCSQKWRDAKGLKQNRHLLGGRIWDEAFRWFSKSIHHLTIIYNYNMGLSENGVPLNPMVNDHYPVFKWLYIRQTHISVLFFLPGTQFFREVRSDLWHQLCFFWHWKLGHPDRQSFGYRYDGIAQYRRIIIYNNHG